MEHNYRLRDGREIPPPPLNTPSTKGGAGNTPPSFGRVLARLVLAFAPLMLACGAALAGNIAGSLVLILIQFIFWWVIA